MVEDERMDRGGIAADLLDRLLLDLVFDAAAAERAHLAAVGIDDHHRSRLLRRRSARLHHLADDQLATLLQGLDQRVGSGPAWDFDFPSPNSTNFLETAHNVRLPLPVWRAIRGRERRRNHEATSGTERHD